MAVLCDEFLGFQPLWFSHLDTEEKKSGGKGQIQNWVTNSIFIYVFPPNPELKIEFGHNFQ